ncbi:MAG: sigma-70 family RNA polymerase sigma factor [Gemmataceae bacterium]
MSSGEQRTSETLLVRLLNREPAGWERLVHIYGPLVRFWAGQAGVREADTEDVCQEVFAALPAGLASFERERQGATFRGWLRGVTRYKAIDFLRARARHPEARGGTSANELLNAAHDPGTNDDPPEQLSGLYHRALRLIQTEFEARSWEMFWRSAIDAHPAEMIAAEMGVSPAAVRKAKSRVLRRLKEEVGDLIS